MEVGQWTQSGRADAINEGRRRFFGSAAMAVAASPARDDGSAAAQRADAKVPAIKPGTNTSFGPLKQIDAGVLNVGYAEAGRREWPVVILLHGWPYDIHSFVDVAPMLAVGGLPRDRPVSARLRHDALSFERRDPQWSAVRRSPSISSTFLDALKIEKAILAGFDWGARTANIVAALWPERMQGDGFRERLSDRQPGSRQDCRCRRRPSLQWWYQFYFATERGRAGYDKYRREFSKLIWQIASPKWQFDDATFDRSAAAFDNPDHVDIVIHNYRWRLGLAEGEPKYRRAGEAARRTSRSSPCPTITMEGDANGAPHPDPSAYAKKFSGNYEHRHDRRAASATTCRRKRRRPLPRPSSMSARFEIARRTQADGTSGAPPASSCRRVLATAIQREARPWPSISKSTVRRTASMSTATHRFSGCCATCSA